jgi:hypothetical protein
MVVTAAEAQSLFVIKNSAREFNTLTYIVIHHHLS